MASKTVLITGCSLGGLGDSLARQFHAKGLRVFATARNPQKMEHFKALGIETIVLDVVSDESIAKCVTKVSELTGGSLDILVNNSGAAYSMPVTDTDINAGRSLFELNVWAPLRVLQAFIPLLLRADKAMIVNHTSVAANVGLPLMGAYAASKAAISMLTDTLRLELKPFGIKVIDLRSGSVASQIFDNMKVQDHAATHLPEGSIYEVARKELEHALFVGGTLVDKIDADLWAKQVVGDLLVKNPHIQIYRGASAFLAWFGRAFLPHTFFDGMLSKMGSMDVVAQKIQEQKTHPQKI